MTESIHWLGDADKVTTAALMAEVLRREPGAVLVVPGAPVRVVHERGNVRPDLAAAACRLAAASFDGQDTRDGVRRVGMEMGSAIRDQASGGGD